MKGTYLGEFEELVLLAAASLPENAYGVAIQRILAEESGREANIGAIHSAVNRLEKKGYLESWYGDPSSTRGGKRKKYYKLTAFGKNALADSMRVRLRLWDKAPELANLIKAHLA